MAEINIANSAGRDAVVVAESVNSAQKVRWIDTLGRQATSVRLLKATIDQDIGALTESCGGLPQVAQALVDGDPEIDLENTGRLLRETSRVYVNPKREIVHKMQFWEIVCNPDGSVRERRPRKVLETNLAGETPLRWSGVLIKKEDACRKFVFSNKVQLHHINGLTFDFLFQMAKELEEKNCLLLLGAGPKSKEPLILRRGGTPHRGFLEGRTQGKEYCLILHYSNMELKAPAATPADAAPDEGTIAEGAS